MKSIYTLLLLGIFFTSCKKDDAKPETFLTLSITNNSAATMTHLYTKYSNVNDAPGDFRNDILPNPLQPGKSIVIERAKQVTNSYIFYFDGDHEKIEFWYKIADEGGSSKNVNQRDYTILDFLNTEKGEEITINIQ